MYAEEYELLKKKSAGLSANAWLMTQLKTNRPTLHRERETWDVVRSMDPAGREINAIAREFNSGYGSKEELRWVSQLLAGMYEAIYALRKQGYSHA